MLHNASKIKFHSGKDSNKMIVRKLLLNFLTHSHIVTTQKKGKVLKTIADKLVHKLKSKTESNKNVLLKYFPNSKLVNKLFDEVGAQVKNVNGGFLRVVKLNQRESDGSLMVRVEWAHPVVFNLKDVKANKSNSKVIQANVANKNKKNDELNNETEELDSKK